MSTISILTFLVLSISAPTYTKFIQDKDVFFYRQKGNFYTITNIREGTKYLGIKTGLANISFRLLKTDTKSLNLAVECWKKVREAVLQNKFDKENYKFYENILDNFTYSDSLAYTFLCWRTSYQYCNNGVSNYSYIPNGFYNKKKMVIINRLKNYLRSHPGAIEAAQQIAYLENLSDIIRGGFMGSSVLNDLVFLSGDRD